MFLFEKFFFPPNHKKKKLCNSRERCAPKGAPSLLLEKNQKSYHTLLMEHRLCSLHFEVLFSHVSYNFVEKNDIIIHIDSYIKKRSIYSVTKLSESAQSVFPVEIPTVFFLITMNSSIIFIYHCGEIQANSNCWLTWMESYGTREGNRNSKEPRILEISS